MITLQMRSALGAQRGTQLGILLGLLLGGSWYAMELTHRQDRPPPEDQTASQPMTSESCVKCHASHVASWHRTYHRTMTRDASAETVKADFNNAVHHYRGVTSRLFMRDGKYFFDTIDPLWEAEMVKAFGKVTPEQYVSARRKELSVDRITGSHWFQQFMHHDGKGTYVRLPLAYHLVENRWVHMNGVFLMPGDWYFGKTGVWNETCLYCHNTRPVKNPAPDGFRTEVGELGISCEACHGSAERHIAAHHNPARRLAQRLAGPDAADPTIINPAKLPVHRADEICARCHGGTVPRYAEWDRRTYRDPYLPGRDLKRFWNIPYSEEEFVNLIEGKQVLPFAPDKRPQPKPRDSRFWGDGTPLTTAVEYQGMALSACYEDGKGKMSCLTCHSMHDAHPNHQVKAGMRTNEACYQCHETYRSKLTEHTHHAADSQGSNCMNCHMPHQVYSLLDTHRSHRISIPRVKDSVGTGKPHACNLCHLDKSLSWTQDRLGEWYKMAPVPLSDEDRTFSSILLHLTKGDGRQRALAAGIFAWKPAHEPSGRDWPAMLLTRILEAERFEAVRYSAEKALRSIHGKSAEGYNYQGLPAERAAQVLSLRQKLERDVVLDRKTYPYLPITPAGSFDDGAFQRLLKERNDPDVHINE
jgi:predicted CXXCH cytochrome family protein